MKYLKSSKLFYGLVLLLLLGLLIRVYHGISFIFDPVIALINGVFLPVILAVFVYFLFYPLYQFLSGRIKKEGLTLALTFGAMVFTFLVLVGLILPSLASQA